MALGMTDTGFLNEYIRECIADALAQRVYEQGAILDFSQPAKIHDILARYGKDIFISKDGRGFYEVVCFKDDIPKVVHQGGILTRQEAIDLASQWLADEILTLSIINP